MNQEAILPLRAAVCGGALIHAALVDVEYKIKLSDVFSSDFFFLILQNILRMGLLRLSVDCPWLYCAGFLFLLRFSSALGPPPPRLSPFLSSFPSSCQ